MKKILVIAAASLMVSMFSFDISAQKNDKYLIAYNVSVSQEGDDYDVFVMEMDGTGKKNITNNPDVAWTYSAYNDRIFFVSDRDACKRCYFLYTMDVQGNDVKKLFDIRLNDSWMGTRKNGREIVVTPRLENEQQFFIVDLDDGKILKKLPINLARIGDPAFSPDGKQIAFRGAVEKASPTRESFDELYIMNADGSDMRQITNYPKDDKTAKWHNYHAGPPRWHPDGKFITYQSVQNGKSSLYAVTPDGTKQWKFTDHELNEGWHSWSPDGKWLAIEMSDEKATEYSIHLMNVETKVLKKLTRLEDGKLQQAPVFVEKNSASKSESRDLSELKRLHQQHKEAHLTYNADLFIETFADQFTQIQSGNVSIKSKKDNLGRFTNYFASFKFLGWEDINPAVYKISKDGTLATVTVEKRVSGTYKNDKGEEESDETIFAWLEVWEKINGQWKVVTVASTSKDQ